MAEEPKVIHLIGIPFHQVVVFTLLDPKHILEEKAVQPQHVTHRLLVRVAVAPLRREPVSEHDHRPD
jgi:hypothetical protein